MEEKIAIIGGGSWATAIVKILSEKPYAIFWWVRNAETAQHIQKFNHNPNYISSAEINTTNITITTDIIEAVTNTKIIVLAVPSAFIKSVLDTLPANSLKGKIVISAIKGIVPETLQIIGNFVHEYHNVPFNSFGVVTGPCHAEEVAMEKLSYLTVASQNHNLAVNFQKKLNCRFIKTTLSDDIFGTEYAAVLKNVIAIACGICNALSYGDNFQAVLISNAIREIKRFVDIIHPINRDIKDSAYLGDLLVTCYSQFSRNKMFGNMIGKGYSVETAQMEMKMIAEGYYATQCIHTINRSHAIELPITDAVYNIIYEKISPTIEMKILSDKIR